MFSKKTQTNSKNDLKQEVKEFLDNSIEFQKMKAIAQKPNMKNYDDFLARLEKCESFGQLKFQCNELRIHGGVITLKQMQEMRYYEALLRAIYESS